MVRSCLEVVSGIGSRSFRTSPAADAKVRGGVAAHRSTVTTRHALPHQSPPHSRLSFSIPATTTPHSDAWSCGPVDPHRLLATSLPPAAILPVLPTPPASTHE